MRQVPIRLALVLAVALAAGCSDGGDRTSGGPRHPPAALRAIAYAEYDAVWLDPAGAEAPRRVAAGAHPSLSPDGRFLAYVEELDASALLKVVGTGLDQAPVTLATNADADVAWARDAPVLAFAVRKSVRIRNLDTNSRTVVRAEAEVTRLSLSPDGSTVAFDTYDYKRDRGGTWIASLDGATPVEARRLTSDEDVYAPYFTPRGLVVTRWSLGELWLIGLDGRLERRIATLRTTFEKQEHGEGVVVDATDDGRSLLVFAYCAHGCSRTEIVDFETGETTLDEYGKAHAISRDGAQILAQEECDSGGSMPTVTLVQIDVATADRHTVVLDPSDCDASWSY